MTEFTYAELLAIEKARSFAKNHGNGAAGSLLVDELVMHDGADRVVEHCASLLPVACYDSLRAYLNKLKQCNYYGKIKLIGPGFDEEIQKSFQPRFRLIAERLTRFLKSPTAPEDMPPPDIDMFWAQIREIPKVSGEYCRKNGCSNRRIQASVFCAEHHYQQIKGCLPSAC